MSAQYILALDQGTTSSRSAIVDIQGKIVALSQESFKQILPNEGWVEHDPMDILDTQIRTIKQVIAQAKINPKDIKGIGVTNQRETTVIWDKKTGKPIYNALVWQDNRTINVCHNLKIKGYEAYIQKTTGLVVDTYFSATKIHWLLQNVKGALDKAKKGELLFGTIDTWLLWHLTDGTIHATDYSNASRTMLFDINKLKWDEKLCQALDIPLAILPSVMPSNSFFGDFKYEGKNIPITSIIGDQQAALFGQGCLKKGQAKNTYGTGCFMLMNTGEKPKYSKHGLLTTIAWGEDDKVTYALEGSVFIAGASVQWLRDGLQILDSVSDSSSLANNVKEDHSVIVVPAFTGLGAPYWDMQAKGTLFGLTLDTQKEHLIKATLEAIAFQTRDILTAMEKDSNIQLDHLKVDGGATNNAYLMQFQSDILKCPIIRPQNTEITVLGTAYMAGLKVKMWSNYSEISHAGSALIIEPKMSSELADKLYTKWGKAVERSLGWDE